MHNRFAVFNLPNRGARNEFLPLQGNPAIHLEWVRPQDYDGKAQVIILPGSARTIDDLKALRESGGARAIHDHLAAGRIVIGICGGFQMLGQRLIDPRLSQGDEKVIEGLGYLPHTTLFGPTKLPESGGPRPWLSCSTTGRLLNGRGKGGLLSGEERRSGFSFIDEEQSAATFLPLMQVLSRELNEALPESETINSIAWQPGRETLDGLVSSDRQIWATYLHMIFHNGPFQSSIFELL